MDEWSLSQKQRVRRCFLPTSRLFQSSGKNIHRKQLADFVGRLLGVTEAEIELEMLRLVGRGRGLKAKFTWGKLEFPGWV